MLETSFAVRGESYVVAFSLEVFAKEHAEVFVVFAEENSCFFHIFQKVRG
jgi:hypothetical protein